MVTSKREPTNGFQNYFMFNVQLAMDAFKKKKKKKVEITDQDIDKTISFLF